MRTVCRFALLAKPACLAARCAAPAIGVTNATPVPGRSGARRAMTNSRLALPPARARSFSASPPGRSSILTTHVSTRVTLSALVSSFLLGAVCCASSPPPLARQDRRHTGCAPGPSAPGVAAAPRSRVGDLHALRQRPVHRAALGDLQQPLLLL